MKRCAVLLAYVLTGFAAVASAEEARLPLRVLYVGSSMGPRAGQFAAFLKEHFAHVTVAEREGFKPEAARDADVVLFDWSQSEGDLAKTAVPLGRCEDWAKPTVLLNHAGLLVAAHWQLIGGSG